MLFLTTSSILLETGTHYTSTLLKHLLIFIIQIVESRRITIKTIDETAYLQNFTWRLFFGIWTELCLAKDEVEREGQHLESMK